MLSAAIFFRDNHGVIAPPSLMEQSDFLSVETVGRAGEAEARRVEPEGSRCFPVQ